jgi:hypothetical protein
MPSRRVAVDLNIGTRYLLALTVFQSGTGYVPRSKGLQVINQRWEFKWRNVMGGINIPPSKLK